MTKAYRIPTTPNAVEVPTDLAKQTVPINRMNVRSFFVIPSEPSRPAHGQVQNLEGIAFDGGSGIQHRTGVGRRGNHVAGGRPRRRPGPLFLSPMAAGVAAHRDQASGPASVRAINGAGETQPAEPGWNRAGYMRNVMEELLVNVV